MWGEGGSLGADQRGGSNSQSIGTGGQQLPRGNDSEGVLAGSSVEAAASGGIYCPAPGGRLGAWLARPGVRQMTWKLEPMGTSESNHHCV